VLDVIAATVPDRDMIVGTDVRRTFTQVSQRTRSLAGFLVQSGMGAHRERLELERWQSGQSAVAILMSNCPEYVETMIGAFRARATPFGVNQHYHPREVAELLNQIGHDVVVYHRRFGPLLREWEPGRSLLIEVDDGSDSPVISGSIPYEDTTTSSADPTLPPTSPDDLYVVCTGGTTGRPKGVLWRQADALVATMSFPAECTEADLELLACGADDVALATPPLMHSSGQRTVFSAITRGGTAVIHDDSHPFDARTILRTAELERVTMMSIIGNAYARPLVEELRTGDYALPELRAIGTGGAAMSDALKDELTTLLPRIAIIESFSSSETGGMGRATTAPRQGRSAPKPADFHLSANAAVLSDDRSRFLRAGESETGWAARCGRVPLGYLNDPHGTNLAFPVVEGQRVAIPGDRARIAADGSVMFLGRDTMVINTGGEKVFAEEVEAAIGGHPAVEDVLVVGRPEPRFGQEVVAVVRLRDGMTSTPSEIREFATTRIARFKAPRAVAFCDRTTRQPSGKPDYHTARELAVDAVPAYSADLNDGNDGRLT
jgi:fatty-acyl-CoA synthase